MDKCKECGSTEFDILSDSIQAANLKNGDLTATGEESGSVQCIVCSECGKEYNLSDFNNLYM